MTIKKPVKTTPDMFISGAPDAKPEPEAKPAPGPSTIRGKKQIITVGFSPEQLAKIDAAATENGISRAAFINLACSQATAKH